MQINVDMNQMMQEQIVIMQMCKEYESCINCPMKEKGFIDTNMSKWSCENASKV